MSLTELFEPINELYIPNPPDNLHNLYEIQMVRISDVHTLNLDKNAPATQLYDSPNPNSILFEKKKGEVEQ